MPVTADPVLHSLQVDALRQPKHHSVPTLKQPNPATTVSGHPGTGAGTSPL